MQSQIAANYHPRKSALFNKTLAEFPQSLKKTVQILFHSGYRQYRAFDSAMELRFGFNRKTVVFLPLIETSKLFCKHCNELGLKAVHVDGNDRSLLNSDWNVICNASLLTTGWDEPSVAEKKAMTGKSGKPLSVEEFTAKKNPTEQPRNYGDCLGFVHDIQRWFIQSKERGIFDDMDVEQLAFERGKLKPVAEIYNEFNAMIRENKDFQKNNTTNQCNMNQNQVWAKN